MQHVLTQLIHQIKTLQLLKVVPGRAGGLAELWLWAWFNFRWTDWLGLFTQFDHVLGSPLAEPLTSVVAVWMSLLNLPSVWTSRSSWSILQRLAEASRAAEFLRVFFLLQWSGAFVLTHPCRPLPPRSICVFHQWMRSNAALTPLQFVCEDFQETKVQIRLLTSSCTCDW